MKVLFLDFDGVIRTTRSRLSSTTTNGFDPIAGSLVNQLCQIGGLQLVICSAWREGRSLPEISDLLAEAAVESRHLHTAWATPIMHVDRWLEVQAWLQAHAPGGSFCVVDDGIGFPESASWLVRPDIDLGFGFREFLQVASVLRIDVVEHLRAREVRLTASEAQLVTSSGSLIPPLTVGAPCANEDKSK